MRLSRHSDVKCTLLMNCVFLSSSDRLSNELDTICYSGQCGIVL